MKKRIKQILKENRNIFVNIIGAFTVKGGSLVISVILLPLYLRFFQNQAVLGTWYTILSVLNWVMLFDLGLGQGLRNQLPKALLANDKRLAKKYISTTYILMTVVALVISVLGIIAIKWVNLYSLFNVDESIIEYRYLLKGTIIVFLGIMFQIVLKIVTSILYAMQKSAMVNALGLITNILILCVLCIVPSRDVGSNLVTMSWVNVIAANVPYLICTFLIFRTKTLKGTGPSIKNFSKEYVRDIFNVGISLLWLQVVFMIVSSTNEFLISKFTEPRFVVEYQAYYKVFKTAAMVVSLALTPIWSAVTKSLLEKKYKWIKKIYMLFLGASGLCFLGEVFLIPVLQFGMDVWLGKGTIIVSVEYAFVFALSSTVFVIHSVNTSIGNGMSYFSLQMVWMTVAAMLFIPLAWLFVNVFDSWIGVVFASVLAMLPYEILAPICTIRKLNIMETKSEKESKF